MSAWNIYLFQFSDGDNWGDDNSSCLERLQSDLLPICNLFCYGQVTSPWGSGEFLHELESIQDEWPTLITSMIQDKDDILAAIQQFLGTGR